VIEKEAFQKKLGEKVRQIRKEKGISQKELAYSVGKDQQSIQRLEVGKMNPTLFYLCQIADGLQVDVALLMNISPD
jgi:putative transcriptional regulator